MKNIALAFLLLPFSLLVNGQIVSQVDKNYTIEEVYDENGNVISHVRTYMDRLGRTQQVQIKDFENNKILVTQSLYDRFGRSAIQSLAAPASTLVTTTDEYLGSFMKNNSNNNYGISDFDLPNNNNSAGEVNNPNPVYNSGSQGTLGWYYSNSNGLETHVPASSYPYSRITYSPDLMGNLDKTAMAGEKLKMGSGNEKQFTTHWINTLSTTTNYSVLDGSSSAYWVESIDEAGLKIMRYYQDDGKIIAERYPDMTIEGCPSPSSVWTRYIYNSENLLSQIILPSSYGCSATPAQQPQNWSESSSDFIISNSGGSNPTFGNTTNPNLIESGVLNTIDANTEEGSYVFNFSTFGTLTDFRNNPARPCTTYEDQAHPLPIPIPEMRFEGNLIQVPAVGEGFPAPAESFLDGYDMNLESAKKVSRLFGFEQQEDRAVEFITTGTLTETQGDQLLEDYLFNNLIAPVEETFDTYDQRSLVALDFNNQQGENTQALNKPASEVSFTDWYTNGFNTPQWVCDDPLLHCRDGILNCGETITDDCLSGSQFPPCHNKPDRSLGTFKIKIEFKARNRSTGIWEAIAGFNPGVNEDGSVNPANDNPIGYVEYVFELMVDCQCRYTLVLKHGPQNIRGMLTAAQLDMYDKIKFDMTSVKYSLPKHNPRIYNPIDWNDEIQDMARVLKFKYSGQLKTDLLETNTITPEPNPTFTYNYYNQLKTEFWPEKGTTEYFYDDLHRLKFWQTEVLREDDKYAYLDYDERGRIIARGVLTSASFPTAVLNSSVTNSSFTKEEEHFVEYDKEGSTFPSTSFTSYKHKYLKGKVSKTENEESATWFGYDQQGRISWTVQHIKEWDKFYTINYTYNAQGNVALLDFQKENSSERFVHQYTYDANARLLKVETSTDGSSYTQHALYEYYQHGALKRVELGDELQGIDYVYTINGWLKSINNPVLGSRDPGGDGESGAHASFAQDVFGMTLDYFREDYVRDNTGIQSYTPSTLVPGLNGAPPTLYVNEGQHNGNIGSIRWRTRSETNGSSPDLEGKQLIETAQYDERHRLIEAKFGYIDPAQLGIQNISGQSVPPNTYDGPTPLIGDDWKVDNITYDIKGNLKTLNRNGTASASLAMDELEFNRNNNQLNYINDAHARQYAADLDNQDVDNYLYDVSGRLTSDIIENNYITYNYDNLPLKVFSNASHTTLKGNMRYDERGQRLIKFGYRRGKEDKSETIVRDVNGTIMAIVYQDKIGSSTDYPVYGAGQLGYYNNSSQSYRYQFTDHLGNVRATISDTTVNNDVELVSMQDYYPFGSKMPGRSITASTFYKLGYQSQPEEAEMGGYNSFELRLYDARIGGWLSPDPYNQHHSPYMAMSNNPLSFIDPDGGFDFGWNDGKDPDAWGNAGTNSIEFWEQLGEACPDCDGQQLSELRFAWGTGRQDQVIQRLNEQNYEAGYVYLGEEEYLKWDGTLNDNTNKFIKATRPVYGEYNAAAMNESSVLSYVQTGLDIIGLVPVLGEAADGINAIIYAVNGDYTNAALSAAAMVPVAGAAATGGKLLNKAYKSIKGSKTFMKYQGNFVLGSGWKNWGNYMKKRGWSGTDIQNTLTKGNWSSHSGTNYLNPGNSMSVVTNPNTGKSLIIDNVTKEIIQLGGKGFKY